MVAAIDPTSCLTGVETEHFVARRNWHPSIEKNGSCVDVGREFEVPVELEDAFVCFIGDDSSTVDAEYTGATANPDGRSRVRLDLQAQALNPPVNIEIELDHGDWQPGQMLRAMSPQGPICLQVPCDATPGVTLRYQLAPKPEYRIEVPSGAGPGTIMIFQKVNGDACQVTVPADVDVGETFEVTPPALMVRVPESALPGDFVRFSRACPEENKATRIEFFRAPIPEGFTASMYFAARLPPPRI